MPRTINPILRARIESGRVVWQGIDGKRWDTVKRFLEGKEVDISIGPHRKKRSVNQNSYYWGVVVAMIAEAAGYPTPEEAHDALRLHFLGQHREGQLPTMKSTAELSTTEFEDYLSHCRQLASEMFGLYIPEPNEVDPNVVSSGG